MASTSTGIGPGSSPSQLLDLTTPPASPGATVRSLRLSPPTPCPNSSDVRGTVSRRPRQRDRGRRGVGGCSTTVVHGGHHFRIFDLPPELRLMIYEFYIFNELPPGTKCLPLMRQLKELDQHGTAQTTVGTHFFPLQGVCKSQQLHQDFMSVLQGIVPLAHDFDLSLRAPNRPILERSMRRLPVLDPNGASQLTRLHVRMLNFRDLTLHGLAEWVRLFVRGGALFHGTDLTQSVDPDAKQLLDSLRVHMDDEVTAFCDLYDRDDEPYPKSFATELALRERYVEKGRCKVTLELVPAFDKADAEEAELARKLLQGLMFMGERLGACGVADVTEVRQTMARWLADRAGRHQGYDDAVVMNERAWNGPEGVRLAYPGRPRRPSRAQGRPKR